MFLQVPKKYLESFGGRGSQKSLNFGSSQSTLRQCENGVRPHFLIWWRVPCLHC